MSHGGSGTSCRVVGKWKLFFLFRSSLFARSEMSMLQWEERVAHNMVSYECNSMTGFYPPIGMSDDDRGRWTELEKEHLEAEWHFEQGWRQS